MGIGELRRDVDLPFVEDGSPLVVIKLASLLLDVVGSELPGVGIVHTSDRQTSQRGMHHWHGNLMLAALKLLEPQVKAAEELSGTLYLGLGRNYSPAHEDYGRHKTPRNACLETALRLHTADGSNGAHITMANSAPGCMSNIGDAELFEDLGVTERQRRGYDMNDRTWNHQLIEIMDEGSYDPTVAEPTVYHFDQTPSSSVIFRSVSSMGPVTIHGFWPLDPNQNRNIRISDVAIQSQVL